MEKDKYTKEIRQTALDFYNLFYSADLPDYLRSKTAKKFALNAVGAILGLPSMHEGRMIVVMQEDYEHWQSVYNLLQEEY